MEFPNKPSEYMSSSSMLIECETVAHSSRGRLKQSTVCEKGPPALTEKFKKVWKRVRIKLKATRAINQLRNELNLYGTSTAKPIMQSRTNEFETTGISNRASRLLDVTLNLPSAEFNSTCIINPNSNFSSVWNWIIIGLLIYTAIFTPFFIAFIENDIFGIYVLEIVVSVSFFLDFCVNLNTAYFDLEQNLIIDRWAILKHYLKGWMLIDLITCTPFYLFEDQVSSNKGNYLTKILRIPKLYRLLRLSKLAKIVKKHILGQLFDKIQTILSVKSTVLTIVRSYFTVIMFVHIQACLWYFSAHLDDFSPDTWVVRYNYQDASIDSLYISSLYWTVTSLSTTGYGDIVPHTTLEKSLALIWMGFGLHFFAFNISRLTSMICSIDLRENALASKQEIIESFSSESKLSNSIRNKLIDSITYASKKRGFSWMDKMKILNELPKTLRYEIAMAMHHGAAKSIKFFQNKDQSIIAIIVPMLEPICIDKNSHIFLVGDAAEDIFFITRGIATIFFGRLIVKDVKKGSYFGDIEVVRKIRRRFDAFAETYCEVLVMNKQAIKNIQKVYPYLWQFIHFNALKKEKKYEKIIVYLQEMEKYNRGDIEFDDFEAEFSLYVQKIVQKKMSEIRQTDKSLTVQELVKNADDLIEIARKFLKSRNEFSFMNS